MKKLGIIRKVCVFIKVLKAGDLKVLISVDKTIKITCIHPIVLIIHKMFKYEVTDVAVIGEFEYILTQIVHSLQITVVRMIERKSF